MESIKVSKLLRKYGSFTAVKGIDFDVNEGEIFGFLGPNGAGKSTTISMLCTLLRPKSGDAVVNGYDIVTQPNEVRQSIGVIFQDPSLDERLTGRENLDFHAMIYNVPRKDYEERVDELLEMVELKEKAKDLVKTYSGGMRRRLEIARGLIHDPKVLFLDEPTIGLDPQTRNLIWEYLLRLREQKDVTMFMTTHYMDEAEHCDRIAVIDHGEIIALDTPDGLKNMMGGDIVTIKTSDNKAAAQKLKNYKPIEMRFGPDGQLIVEVKHGDQFIPLMMNIMADTGNPIEVQSVNLSRPTLDDVFMKLTGRQIREEEANAMERMRSMSRSRGRR
jgi:ABC-2 type transport system ATP-binding protein